MCLTQPAVCLTQPAGEALLILNLCHTFFSSLACNKLYNREWAMQFSFHESLNRINRTIKSSFSCFF